MQPSPPPRPVAVGLSFKAARLGPRPHSPTLGAKWLGLFYSHPFPACLSSNIFNLRHSKHVPAFTWAQFSHKHRKSPFTQVFSAQSSSVHQTSERREGQRKEHNYCLLLLSLHNTSKTRPIWTETHSETHCKSVPNSVWGLFAIHSKILLHAHGLVGLELDYVSSRGPHNSWVTGKSSRQTALNQHMLEQSRQEFFLNAFSY